MPVRLAIRAGILTAKRPCLKKALNQSLPVSVEAIRNITLY
jgi:hypothetical protein